MYEQIILIVEDDPDCAMLLDKIISYYGYKPLLTDTGKAAMKIIDEESCDGIFLDISLPDIDGIEVAHYVRDKKGSAFPIIALTGYSKAELASLKPHALDCFKEVCEKPFDMKKIEKTLQKHFPKTQVNRS